MFAQHLQVFFTHGLRYTHTALKACVSIGTGTTGTQTAAVGVAKKTKSRRYEDGVYHLQRARRQREPR